jgi:hypothetical protein
LGAFLKRSCTRYADLHFASKTGPLERVGATIFLSLARMDFVLSKCANPECSETFRFLRQGKLFRLDPTPTLQSSAAVLGYRLYERFWLCDKCSLSLTILWNGKHAQISRLPDRVEGVPPAPPLPPLKGLQRVGSEFLRRRAAAAGSDGR